MNDRPPMLIREDLWEKVSRRKGFDYSTLKDAIVRGVQPLSRLNLPDRPDAEQTIEAVAEMVANTEPAE